MAERTTASVILPTYNEAESAPGVVAQLRSFGIGEVVVVDDGSPDGTASRIRTRFADDDSVHVIVRENESGLSSAVLRGIRYADGGLYGVMDADGQHPPWAMLELTRAARSADVDLFVGSRRAGAVSAEWPLHRRAISRGADWLARVAIPPARELSDPMSGLFVVRAELVDGVLEQLQPEGYKILLEILSRCPIEDVYEMGYDFRPAKSGSNLGPDEYISYLKHLARLSLPARRERVGDCVDSGETDVIK